MASSAPPAISAPIESDKRFHPDILRIAAVFTRLSRADGTFWAPEDCRAPIHPAFLSKATAGGHERKLYALWVKDFDAYAALDGPKLPDRPRTPFLAGGLEGLGQVIVKEAWTPTELPLVEGDCPGRAGSSLAPVTMDGKRFTACSPAGLFVMYQPSPALAPKSATDDGWIYGTATIDLVPSGREGQWHHVPRVTSAGRVGSCMGCHAIAPHGRLFGLRRE